MTRGHPQKRCTNVQHTHAHRQGSTQRSTDTKAVTCVHTHVQTCTHMAPSWLRDSWANCSTKLSVSPPRPLPPRDSPDHTCVCAHVYTEQAACVRPGGSIWGWGGIRQALETAPFMGGSQIGPTPTVGASQRAGKLRHGEGTGQAQVTAGDQERKPRHPGSQPYPGHPARLSELNAEPRSRGRWWPSPGPACSVPQFLHGGGKGGGWQGHGLALPLQPPPGPDSGPLGAHEHGHLHAQHTAELGWKPGVLALKKGPRSWPGGDLGQVGPRRGPFPTPASSNKSPFMGLKGTGPAPSCAGNTRWKQGEHMPMTHHTWGTWPGAHQERQGRTHL